MESSSSSPLPNTLRRPISPTRSNGARRDSTSIPIGVSASNEHVNVDVAVFGQRNMDGATDATTTTNGRSNGENHSPTKKNDDSCSSTLTVWRTPSDSHTPHRRHPHHINGKQQTPYLLESPGLSNLWRPASPHGNSPRRVLYSSPRSKLSPRGSVPRSVRLVTRYLTIAVFVAVAIYFYLASSLLSATTQNHNESIASPDAFSIMTQNMPHPPIRSPADKNWWQGQQGRDPSQVRELKASPRVILFDSTEEIQWLSKAIPSMALPLHDIGSEEDDEPSEIIVLIPTTTNSSTTNSTLEERTNSTSDDAGASIPEDKSEFLDFQNDLDDKCEPAESWQVEARPNCNIFHEVDMKPSQSPLLFLGQGWFRSAWRLNQHDASVVIKMLRLEREFLDEYYELHRRDAVAMEHLTFSPFIMNVYGYCGQSAINEIADFREGINSLEQVNRRLRGQYSDGVMVLKLRLALGVAIGLYHVHYGIPGMPWDHNNITARPTMAHYDINPRNVAIIAGGKPKLNDFNIAEFLRYPKGNSTFETCGFPSRLHEPWWRAPEEMDVMSKTKLVNEKVDVYALGAVLYHILTTHSPRGKMKKERMDEIRQQVVKGMRPPLMEPWASRKDPIVMAFKEAMDMCFHKDPRKRGTTKEVATVLYRALENAPSWEELRALENMAKADPHHHDKKKKKKTTHKHADHHHH